MAVEFRDHGGVVGDVGDVTPTAPSSHQANDIEVLLVETANDAVSLSDAQGFAEVAQSPQSAAGTSTLPTRLTVFWRRYDGVVGNPTIADPGNHAIAVIAAYSGAKTSGNPFNSASGTTETTEDTTIHHPGLTTTVPGCMILLCGGFAKPDSVSSTQLSNYVNSTLSSITERVDQANNAGNGGLLGLYDGVMSSAGTLGITSGTTATASYKGLITLALEPAGASSYDVSVSLSRTQVFTDQMTNTLSQGVTLGSVQGVSDAFRNDIGKQVQISMADGINNSMGVGAFSFINLTDILSLFSGNNATLQAGVPISADLGLDPRNNSNLNSSSSLNTSLSVHLSGGLNFLMNTTLSEVLSLALSAQFSILSRLSVGERIGFSPANIATIGGSLSVGQSLGLIDVPSLNAQALINLSGKFAIILDSSIATNQVLVIVQTLAGVLGLSTSAQLNSNPSVGVPTVLGVNSSGGGILYVSSDLGIEYSIVTVGSLDVIIVKGFVFTSDSSSSVTVSIRP